MKITRQFHLVASDIALSHTLFALPFAFSGLLLGGLSPLSFSPLLLAKFLLCMVTARSFAMGMNRWLDHTLDRQNPRTQTRAIPAQKLRPTQMLAWSCLFGLGFILGACWFNSTAGLCSPVVLAILAGYSLMKRYTWGTHWYLGGCLGLAPIAANVAIQGYAPSVVVLLGIAIMMWTAGFDILYATQDVAFDRQMGLYSVPARFGLASAWKISAGCFSVMILLLLMIGKNMHLGTLYHVGVVGVGAMLVYELGLVRMLLQERPSTQLNRAFFTINGWVSVGFYACLQLDFLLK